jgi:hypothetical protein
LNTKETPTLAFFRHSPDDPRQCELVVVYNGAQVIVPVERPVILSHIQELLKFL